MRFPLNDLSFLLNLYIMSNDFPREFKLFMGNDSF
jgi:hypothetical protein